MEVILITQKAEYKSLINASKIIQDENLDIVAILDTEVFLNHHFNICFYAFRNNLPQQNRIPLQIAQQLLYRNQGQVTLQLNKGKKFTFSHQINFESIAAHIENAIKQPIEEKNIYYSHFRIQLWNIDIEFVIHNDPKPHEQKLKQVIGNNLSATEDKIHKTLIFINDQNYEDFFDFTWMEEETQTNDCEANVKLSKEYVILKQQIENQKYSFRNKIKMVEGLLGEKINVEKLLTEEKDENVEFKKLKQTFQTIKNIDEVIKDQQRRVDTLELELKNKKIFKDLVRNQNTLKFVEMTKNIQKAQLDIDELNYKIKAVEPDKAIFVARNSFQPPSDIINFLQNHIAKMKQSIIIKLNKEPRNKSKIVENEKKSKNVMLKRKILEYQKQIEQRKQRISNSSQLNGVEQNLLNQIKNEKVQKNQSALMNSSNFPLQSSQKMQKQQGSKEENIKTMATSISQSNLKNMQNFRNLLMKRANLNSMKLVEKQKNSLKKYEIENISVSNQIQQIQTLLFLMVEYYTKNQMLLQQICKSTKDNGEKEEMKKNLFRTKTFHVKRVSSDLKNYSGSSSSMNDEGFLNLLNNLSSIPNTNTIPRKQNVHLTVKKNQCESGAAKKKANKNPLIKFAKSSLEQRFSTLNKENGTDFMKKNVHKL